MAKGEASSSAAQLNKKKHTDDEPMPDDSTAANKPLQLQRRRVWRACESCRRKKIKCDGCEPTCSQCTSSGSQCTWLQTKDRAALSRHYVQELEARLLHMESLFSQIAPALEHMAPTANSPAHGNTPETVNTETLAPAVAALRSIAPKISSGNTTAATSPSPPASIVDDDVSELFGQLALDEYGHARWIGGSSTMSLIQSFRALTSSPLHRISPMEEDPQAPGPSVNKLYFPAAIFFGKIRALPGPEEVEFPDRDLTDKLVAAYFSRFHFLMPVLDKPAFMRKYATIMDSTHDLSVIRNETAFLSLMFAMFACAANLVEDPRLSTSDRHDDGGMGMVYYEKALILQYISHPNIQVAHVQCFILMSSFLCSVNCLPQAWILIGQAVRAGQDLGLHRSPRRLTISPIEKETRRKIWWGVYTLDRMLAIALGRPLGVNDSDCDAELPVEVDDDHLSDYFAGAPMTQRQPSLMTGTIALIKLYEIGGRVLRQVYALENCRDHLEPERKAELQRTVEALDTELTKWCDDLPIVFKSQSETEEQVSMGAVLCSHYYSVLTTLHRNLLPVKRDQLVTARSTFKAVSSARSCIRLAPSMKHVVPPSHHLAFFIQHLFSSAVIVLLYAMHASDARASSAAMDEAKSTLSALESWEGQWPGARKCKELLIDLVNTATEAIAKGPRDKAAPTPPSSAGPSVASASSGLSAHERRRSVTIAPGPASGSSPRAAKTTRQRRTQSRDQATSSNRRMAAVSPYRVDGGQRARSSSRRRGPDEPDPIDRASLYQSFSSPGATVGGVSSTHSSPASVNLPSPSMAAASSSEHGQQPVQHQQPQERPSRFTNTFSNFTSPLSPAHLPSPQRYEFDYSVQPNDISQNNGQQWSANGEQQLFAAGQADPSMYANTFGFGSTLEGYGAYDNSDLTGAMTGLSTTPPSANFAANGLPFRGLDYIKNYNTGYSLGDQDALWQSYDPGAFTYDPDIPFTLGDANHELNDTMQQHN